MLRPLTPYLLRAKSSTTPEEFCQQFPDPVFLVEPFVRATTSKVQTLASESGDATQRQIAPIRKRPGANSFGIMVTIGRAANNDIQVQAQDISKFHAYVTFGKQMSITDATSTYGTVVQGQRLEPRKSRPLKVEDMVEIGGVKMRYLTPEALFEFLAQETS